MNSLRSFAALPLLLVSAGALACTATEPTAASSSDVIDQGETVDADRVGAGVSADPSLRQLLDETPDAVLLKVIITVQRPADEPVDPEATRDQVTRALQAATQATGTEPTRVQTLAFLARAIIVAPTNFLRALLQQPELTRMTVIHALEGEECSDGTAETYAIPCDEGLVCEAADGSPATKTCRAADALVTGRE